MLCSVGLSVETCVNTDNFKNIALKSAYHCKMCNESENSETDESAGAHSAHWEWFDGNCEHEQQYNKTFILISCDRPCIL